jgi:hypothetical protein
MINEIPRQVGMLAVKRHRARAVNQNERALR